MARLTFDAILILAKVTAGNDYSLADLAFDVFNGYDPQNPKVPTKAAMARASRAARSLVSMKRAVAVPSLKAMDGIRTNDPTGGAIQAQFLMNLVVRGGSERRKGDRRGEEREDGPDQRKGDRRIEPQAHPRPLRVSRPPPPKPVKKPSPFDILNTFKMKD